MKHQGFDGAFRIVLTETLACTETKSEEIVAELRLRILISDLLNIRQRNFGCCGNKRGSRALPVGTYIGWLDVLKPLRAESSAVFSPEGVAHVDSEGVDSDIRLGPSVISNCTGKYRRALLTFFGMMKPLNFLTDGELSGIVNAERS